MTGTENRIERYEWTKNDATTAAADFIVNPTVRNSRYLLAVITSPSRPQPMLRCDDLGNDSTTIDDLAKLHSKVMAVLKAR